MIHDNEIGPCRSQSSSFFGRVFGRSGSPCDRPGLTSLPCDDPAKVNRSLKKLCCAKRQTAVPSPKKLGSPRTLLLRVCAVCVFLSAHERVCPTKRKNAESGTLSGNDPESVNRRSRSLRRAFCARGGWTTATWLILPVVICLSQRLSHACLSASQIKVKPRKAHYISYGSIDRTQLLG